jgi:hypothetical protein
VLVNASTLIIAPDYKIQMGRTIPSQHLCGTLLTAQKTFTGHDGRVSNYAPCTIELGDGAGACVLRKRTANCWLYNKPATLLPRPRVATFTPAIATPPKPPTPVGNGTRAVMFARSPVMGIFDWFGKKPKAKPKAKPKPQTTWVDRQQCIDKEIDRQINGGERVDNAAARRKCGG